VPKAYVALGSNLSDPASQVKKAFSALERLPKTKVIKQSSLYKTVPVGYGDQPNFINAVVEISTQLDPETLLKNLLNIEQLFGRERPFANAPRILDLDLLYYENVVQNTAYLTLPHPRMHLRGFVLLPLAEIAPNLEISTNGETAKEDNHTSNVVKLAACFLNQGIVKLDNQDQT
jgi:2-amino-4-hydroxy-6-hydroxymethyldihydropteridine diphosphokinase